MHQWLEKKVVPATKARPIRLRNDSMPRAFRGDAPELYPQDFTAELKKFRPPSVWADHKGLLAAFGLAALLFGFYFVKWMLTAPPPPPFTPRARAVRQAPAAPPENPSVYVEMLPADGAAKGNSGAPPARH